MKKTKAELKTFSWIKLSILVIVPLVFGIFIATSVINSVNSASCTSNTYDLSLYLPDGWTCQVINDNSTDTANPTTINISSPNFVITAGNIGRLFGAESDKPQEMTSEEFFTTSDMAVRVNYINGVVTEVDATPLTSNMKDFKIVARPKITSLTQLDSNQRDEILKIVETF